MEAGPLLTQITIWLALGCYAWADTLSVWRQRGSLSAQRLAWTAGCAAYLAHVACAFAHYHDWSHTVAWEHTADQTQQMTGWHWGGGIWVNYAFSVLWLVETVRRWITRPPPGNGHRPWQLTVRCIFLFLIVEGAVVFVQSPMRWMGLALSLWLGANLWQAIRQRD